MCPSSAPRGSIALCEEASVKALDMALDPGTTSVGMRIQLDHVAPTAVGHKVRAEATLERSKDGG